MSIALWLFSYNYKWTASLRNCWWTSVNSRYISKWFLNEHCSSHTFNALIQFQRPLLPSINAYMLSQYCGNFNCIVFCLFVPWVALSCIDDVVKMRWLDSWTEPSPTFIKVFVSPISAQPAKLFELLTGEGAKKWIMYHSEEGKGGRGERGIWFNSRW